MARSLLAFASLSLILALTSCSEGAFNTTGPDTVVPAPAKGGGNPGKPGAGEGGSVATIALEGGYGTATDQVVGFSNKGQGTTFNAVTENKIDYTLALPPYGGDDVCVASSSLPAGQTAEEFWNEFVATQNEITLRSFLFTFRLDDKIESNRTEGIYSSGETGRARVFKAGTTGALGLDVNATVATSTDASGNDVYTLSGGALQLRTVAAPGGETEGGVTCPNPLQFTVRVKN